MKLNIELSFYGKQYSLQRQQENHKPLKFKKNSLRGKGRSYLIMPCVKKSATEDRIFIFDDHSAVYRQEAKTELAF